MFCSHAPKGGRTDNLNTHIRAIHGIAEVLVGGEHFTAARFPTRPNILIIKNKRGKEVAGYCFECYTKVKVSTGSLPSKSAHSHVCCSKKSRPDDVPTIEITETAAPAPAPAPVFTIEHHCQAVADYLAEKLGESSYRRRYDAHKVFLEEFDRDDEDESKEAQWSEFLIYLINDIDRNTAVIQSMKAKAKEQADKIADLNIQVASAEANVKHHMAQHSAAVKRYESAERDMDELAAEKEELLRLCRSKGLIPQ